MNEKNIKISRKEAREIFENYLDECNRKQDELANSYFDKGYTWVDLAINEEYQKKYKELQTLYFNKSKQLLIDNNLESI